jgi:SsrA-binding protein
MDNRLWKIIFAENKKAFFDYEIIEEYEAGMRLYGWEVKSLRAGQANLKGSYVTIHSGRPILVGCHISEYKNHTTSIRIDPKRERELLLKENEIVRLHQKTKEMWATLIPVSIYPKGNLFKVRLALARGRKKWEKKNLLKERDLDRESKKLY